MGEGFESRLLSLSQAIDSETEENCRTRVESAHKIAQDRAGDVYLSVGLLGEGFRVKEILYRLWWEDEGQDIAEYAVMLAVILVIVVGTIRLIGSSANNVFSSVASAIQ